MGQSASDCEKENQALLLLNRVLSSLFERPASVFSEIQLRTRVAAFRGSGMYHLSVHTRLSPFPNGMFPISIWHSAFPTNGVLSQAQGNSGSLRGQSSNNPKTDEILSDARTDTIHIGDIYPGPKKAEVFIAELAVAANRYEGLLTYCHYPEKNNSLSGDDCIGYNSNSYAMGLFKSLHGTLKLISEPDLPSLNRSTHPGSDTPVPYWYFVY